MWRCHSGTPIGQSPSLALFPPYYPPWKGARGGMAGDRPEEHPTRLPSWTRRVDPVAGPDFRGRGSGMMAGTCGCRPASWAAPSRLLPPPLLPANIWPRRPPGFDLAGHFLWAGTPPMPVPARHMTQVFLARPMSYQLALGVARDPTSSGWSTDQGRQGAALVPQGQEGWEGASQALQGALGEVGGGMCL